MAKIKEVAMAKDVKLNSVVYSRSVSAERDIPSVLVGNSRWIKDLELLLEDEWPSIYHMAPAAALPEQFAKHGSGLALVEGTSDIEQTRHCIEAALPPHIKKVLVVKDGENPFTKRAYVNYGARTGISVVEVSDVPKEAAKEISALLSTLLARVRIEIEEDIDRAELLVEGFGIQSDVPSIQDVRWTDRAEAVVSWIFPLTTLTTLDYRLLRLLVKAQPLLRKQDHWPPAATDTLLPLMQFAQNGKISDLLKTSIQLAEKLPVSGQINTTDLTAVLNASSLGMLTKRTLIRSLASLTMKKNGLVSKKVA